MSLACGTCSLNADGHCNQSPHFRGCRPLWIKPFGVPPQPPLQSLQYQRQESDGRDEVPGVHWRCFKCFSKPLAASLCYPSPLPPFLPQGIPLLSSISCRRSWVLSPAGAILSELAGPHLQCTMGGPPSTVWSSHCLTIFQKASRGSGEWGTPWSGQVM